MGVVGGVWGGGVGCLDGGGEAVRAVVSIPKLGLQ